MKVKGNPNDIGYIGERFNTYRDSIIYEYPMFIALNNGIDEHYANIVVKVIKKNENIKIYFKI